MGRPVPAARPASSSTAPHRPERGGGCRPARRVTSEWRARVMAGASTTAKAAAPKQTKAQREAAGRLKQAQRAAILLKQVSDPTRLQVILMLSEGERHVGGLCGELNQSQPAVSHHLALLRHGGIIVPRRQGKNNFYSLTETGERLAGIVKDLAR